MVRLGDINPLIWDVITEQMEDELREFKFKAEDIEFDWRVNAASRKLERELFEQYGVWKDIILDPRFQYIKQLAEENVNFDFQLGDPFIPFATSVIILFMIYKRVNNSILALIAGLIFNINPFYVFLSLLSWRMVKNKKPRQYVKTKVTKSNIDRPLQSIPFQPEILPMEYEYDHILIGNDISTLYCAALLSKVGHKCCILKPRGVLPLEVRLEFNIL
jgi:hypothetical protein